MSSGTLCYPILATLPPCLTAPLPFCPLADLLPPQLFLPLAFLPPCHTAPLPYCPLALLPPCLSGMSRIHICISPIIIHISLARMRQWGGPGGVAPPGRSLNWGLWGALAPHPGRMNQAGWFLKLATSIFERLHQHFEWFLIGRLRPANCDQAAPSAGGGPRRP